MKIGNVNTVEGYRNNDKIRFLLLKKKYLRSFRCKINARWLLILPVCKLCSPPTLHTVSTGDDHQDLGLLDDW